MFCLFNFHEIESACSCFGNLVEKDSLVKQVLFMSRHKQFTAKQSAVSVRIVSEIAKKIVHSHWNVQGIVI